MRAGALGMVVSAPFVEAMKRAGMRLREYRTDPGRRRDCTIRADEDAVVSRLRAPLAGVKRVDIVKRVEAGGVAQGESARRGRAVRSGGRRAGVHPAGGGAEEDAGA